MLCATRRRRWRWRRRRRLGRRFAVTHDVVLHDRCKFVFVLVCVCVCMIGAKRQCQTANAVNSERCTKTHKANTQNGEWVVVSCLVLFSLTVFGRDGCFFFFVVVCLCGVSLYMCLARRVAECVRLPPFADDNYNYSLNKPTQNILLRRDSQNTNKSNAARRCDDK